MAPTSFQRQGEKKKKLLSCQWMAFVFECVSSCWHLPNKFFLNVYHSYSHNAIKTKVIMPTVIYICIAERL